MDIRVSGHQVDVGEALRGRVQDRLASIADKYFSRMVSAQVTFGKGPHDHGFTSEIVAYGPHGLVLKGTDRGAEAAAAFEGSAEKIEKQVRRYTRRLKDRQGPNAAEVAQEIAADASYRVFDGGNEEEEPADNPPIIAETRVDIPEASVSDAVMLLDLRNTNALMFRNSATTKFNMVYRRGDGTIGWVEPQRD